VSRWLWLLGLVLLSGCDRAADQSAAADVDSSRTNALARGELLSFACQACHSLQRDGPHLLGPNLYGIFGRTAGSAVGFSGYSVALRNSGVIWSPAELDRWLANPADFLPGTTMSFTGYQQADDRKALIEFLIAATGADGVAARD